MFNVNFTHSTSNGSNAKQFAFTGAEGMTITEKVPPQAQHIIQLAYALSLDQPVFSYADLIAYIEECCLAGGTNFTNSKGGVERIVRYYSKLLQEIGIITNISDLDETEED